MADRMVIDASVAFKWFVKDHLEDDLDIADEILSRFLFGGLELHAPWNFVDEVCGNLVRATRYRDPKSLAPRLTPKKAFSCAEDLLRFPIECAKRKNEDVIRAITLAIDGSKSYYDMTYLGLAERLNCQWCTADANVSQATPPSFPTGRILLLSSFI